MHRRGDQRARPRHRLELGAHVGREKGPAGMHGEAALHRDEHRRFQAVHVLRRHGADDCDAGESGEPEGVELGARRGDQAAPGLRMRHRVAGGARSEHDGRHLLFRNSPPGYCTGLRSRKTIVEAIAVRIGAQQAFHHVRRVVGRHQAHLSAQQRRGEPGREAIAPGALVDHVAALRQAARQVGHVGEELRGRYGGSLPPGERSGRFVAHERQIGHRLKR